MSYCDQAAVAEEINGLTAFTTTSNPTLTTVQNWIAQVDALIEAKVGLRYVTPVTATAALAVLEAIAVMMVSSKVRRRLNRSGPSSDVAGKVIVTDTWDQAQKMLDKIVNGEMKLDGAELINSEAGVSAFSTSLCTPHVFKKDCEQW